MKKLACIRLVNMLYFVVFTWGLIHLMISVSDAVIFKVSNISVGLKHTECHECLLRMLKKISRFLKKKKKITS